MKDSSMSSCCWSIAGHHRLHRGNPVYLMPQYFFRRHFFVSDLTMLTSLARCLYRLIQSMHHEFHFHGALLSVPTCCSPERLRVVLRGGEQPVGYCAVLY